MYRLLKQFYGISFRRAQVYIDLSPGLPKNFQTLFIYILLGSVILKKCYVWHLQRWFRTQYSTYSNNRPYKSNIKRIVKIKTISAIGVSKNRKIQSWRSFKKIFPLADASVVEIPKMCISGRSQVGLSETATRPIQSSGGHILSTGWCYMSFYILQMRQLGTLFKENFNG